MSQLLFDENQIFFFSYVGSCSGEKPKNFLVRVIGTRHLALIFCGGGAVTAINKITITNKSFIYVSVYIFCDLLCNYNTKFFYLL